MVSTLCVYENMLRLMIMLGYMCHILSSAWVFIGRRLEHLEGKGWIVQMKEEGLLINEPETKYWTLYIVGLYYILTTLSTVGYGDVIGTENIEYCFQMIVMVIEHLFHFLIDYWYWFLRILYGKDEYPISELRLFRFSRRGLRLMVNTA